MISDSRTRRFLVIAQDPSVKRDGKILAAQVAVPSERLQLGPRGYRVNVIDYDSTRRTYYEPADLEKAAGFEGAEDDALLADPRFHAQNVYAIVMRTLSRLEFALGRRISWGFYGHQLRIAPHAFEDANAFYSERDHGLLFGYFRGRDEKPVFTCLSHDVVAHETTHALLDGLRDHYTDPSLPDQAAFHEGFADLVALLSVFSLPTVVKALVGDSAEVRNGNVSRSVLTADWLKQSALLGLAEQMGTEISEGEPRRDALRRSATRIPDPTALGRVEFLEPHIRGEILVAAVLTAFAKVWEARLGPFGDPVPSDRISEEGAAAAEHLLNIIVRALDYCPPVDLEFGDFLSAILTADRELVPDDSRYGYRVRLWEGFRDWGIEPASTEADEIERGTWGGPGPSLSYNGIHFESLQRDPDEVFRFLWENRTELKVYEGAFTRVNWVRPCVRVGPDGFVLRETLAEYIQMIDIEARNLADMGLEAPLAMPGDVVIRLYGGGTVIFDEFGRLKYHVRKRIDNTKRQQAKIDYLWRGEAVDSQNRLGVFAPLPPSEQFALWHRLRVSGLRGGT